MGYLAESSEMKDVYQPWKGGGGRKTWPLQRLTGEGALGRSFCSLHFGATPAQQQRGGSLL